MARLASSAGVKCCLVKALVTFCSLVASQSTAPKRKRYCISPANQYAQNHSDYCHRSTSPRGLIANVEICACVFLSNILLLHASQLHFSSQEEEQKAEEELSRRDSGCPTSAWVHGASSPSPLPSEEEKTPGDTPGNPSVTPTPTPTPTPTQASAIASAALPERENTELGQQDTVTAAGSSDGVVLGTPVEAEGTDGEISAHGGEGGDGRGVKVGELQNDGVREGRGAAVPDFRLNGFVYVCPLVSDGCKFTAKAWLQDEDD